MLRMAARRFGICIVVSVFIGVFCACGDRVGEPIVWATALDGAGGSSAGEAGASGSGATPGGSGGQDVVDPGGLCAPCESGRQCGDMNDYCLEQNHDQFCGRDCEEDGGCPLGYSCVLIAGRDESQCIPASESCDHVADKPPLPTAEAIAAEALELVNDLRFERGLFPLVLDECLSEVAQESAAELSESGDYLGKFERECDGQNSCECGWAAEWESSVAAYDLRYYNAVEFTVGQNASGPTQWRFSRAVFSPQYTRFGFGLVMSGDEAWAALAFGL